MAIKSPKVVAATAIVALFGLGGAGYAYAASTPTTTVPPAHGSAPYGGSTANCPNMGPNSTPKAQGTNSAT